MRSLLVNFDLPAVFRYVQSREIYLEPSIAAEYQCYCKNAPLAAQSEHEKSKKNAKLIMCLWTLGASIH